MAEEKWRDLVKQAFVVENSQGIRRATPSILLTSNRTVSVTESVKSTGGNGGPLGQKKRRISTRIKKTPEKKNGGASADNWHPSELPGDEEAHKVRRAAKR